MFELLLFLALIKTNQYCSSEVNYTSYTACYEKIKMCILDEGPDNYKFCHEYYETDGWLGE